MLPEELNAEFQNKIENSIIEDAEFRISYAKSTKKKLLSDVPKVVDLLKDAPLLKSAKSLFISSDLFYIKLPLDKKLMNLWIKLINESSDWEWRYSPPEQGDNSFFVNYGGIDIVLIFSEKVEGATCSRVKIGCLKQDVPIYEIICEEGRKA